MSDRSRKTVWETGANEAVIHAVSGVRDGFETEKGDSEDDHATANPVPKGWHQVEATPE